jgi:Pretoxin HINT domain
MRKQKDKRISRRDVLKTALSAGTFILTLRHSAEARGRGGSGAGGSGGRGGRVGGSRIRPLKCFTGDTNVVMADGTRRPISLLREGEKVLSFDLLSNVDVPAVVTDIHRSTSRSHLVLNDTIKVTGKHPFAVGMDVWKRAEQLGSGDRIIGRKGKDLRVRSVRAIARPESVFNLSVDEPNNFYVSDGKDSYLVHNKCFTGDTNVVMADGTRKPISLLREGEKVLSFDLLSNVDVPAVVTDIHRSTSRSHLVLNHTIKVTGKHPFAVGMDVWKRAEQLQSGDRIIGKGKDLRVRSVRAIAWPESVFNLSVDEPNNFYVSDGKDSYLVHNKTNTLLYCAIKGSKVRMADGRLKKIEIVRPGDKVKGFDLTTEKWASYPVTQVEVASRDRGYYLINKTLKITSEHRLVVDGSQKAAAELTLGARLTDGRRCVRVTSIELVKEKVEKYNIVLGVNHDLAYSVDGVLVKNECY